MRSALLLIVFTFLGPIVYAQQCTGNLGENIFTEGDFGSGSANILTPDPGIAPGFIYQPSPPPNDGFYTITNNMARWSNTFGTWRRFGDNSSDPNGYMMIVNASYEPGLFYEQVVEGLCENTLYQFTADVANVLMRNSNNILPNISFLIDGQDFFTTGNIPEDEKWNTYGFTFTTAPGQTSVTLALRNNAPGGTGNDLALDNISFRACGPEALILPLQVANICEDGDPITLSATINGDQFDSPAVQWQQSFDNGENWQVIPGANGTDYVHRELSSGQYYYRYLVANSPANLANSKCYIISNTKIVNVVPKEYSVADTICRGLTYEIGNASYSQTGTYTETLVSSLGCDSIVELDLVVLDDPGLVGSFTAEDPSCSYLDDGRVVLTGVQNGRPPYTFEFSGKPTAIGANIDSLAEGVYRYRIQDRFGCNLSDTIRLRSPLPFTVELGDDKLLDLGEEVRVLANTSEPTSTIRWEPLDSVDCVDNCEELSFIPTSSMTLRVFAESDAGCVAEDSLRVRVFRQRKIYIPGAISPNGDGKNDRFTVFASGPNVRTVASLKIFNRWGGEVFSAQDFAPNDPEAGWDATMNGRKVPAGSYTYVAAVMFIDGVVQTYTGSVVVVR